MNEAKRKFSAATMLTGSNMVAGIEEKAVSYDKLKKYLAETHPCKSNKEPYTCCEACCFGTGFHHPCCGSSSHD